MINVPIFFNEVSSNRNVDDLWQNTFPYYFYCLTHCWELLLHYVSAVVWMPWLSMTCVLCWILIVVWCHGVTVILRVCSILTLLLRQIVSERKKPAWRKTNHGSPLKNAIDNGLEYELVFHQEQNVCYVFNMYQISCPYLSICELLFPSRALCEVLYIYISYITNDWYQFAVDDVLVAVSDCLRICGQWKL